MRSIFSLLMLISLCPRLAAGDPQWEQRVRRNFRDGKHYLATGKPSLAFRYWQAAFENEPPYLTKSQALLMHEVAFCSHLLALHLNEGEKAEHYKTLLDRYLAKAVEAGFIPDGRFMLRGVQMHAEMTEALTKCPRKLVL